MFNFLKKHVNFVMVIVTVVFIFGVVGISSKVYAAPSSNIGVVDFQFLMHQQLNMASVQKSMKTDADLAQKAFNDKNATITKDEDKQAYLNQLQQQLDERKEALLASIQDQVIAAVKNVAEVKGLVIVVDKNNTIYGGQDITVDVGKIMGSK